MYLKLPLNQIRNWPKKKIAIGSASSKIHCTLNLREWEKYGPF